MQDWRAQYLGLTTFPTGLTAAEIDELFTLNGEIAPVVGARPRSLTRLGLVLQNGFLRLTGRSLNFVHMIPPAVLERAGQAAGTAAPRLASIRSIYRRRMTLYQHQQAAMAAMGFKDYGEVSERGLTGMAQAFAVLADNDEAQGLGHAEWLAPLLDHEATYRNDRRLALRLRHARLRHHAMPEDVNYRASRGLDRRLFDMLLKGDWISAHESLAIIGPTGVGKSWLACALGHKACRDNRSVLYTRLPRPIDELPLQRRWPDRRAHEEPCPNRPAYP